MLISPIVKIICPRPKARLRNFVNGIHEEFVKAGATIIIIMSDPCVLHNW
jgi:S-methylmethionine-dependent homocysteine/selenocysteine methylase